MKPYYAVYRFRSDEERQRFIRANELMGAECPWTLDKPDEEIEASDVLVMEERDLSIEHMELTVRAYNCIRHLHLETIGDVADRTAEELMKTKNFGRESLKAIAGSLASFGLALAVPEKNFRYAGDARCHNTECNKRTAYCCDFCASFMCVRHQKAHRELCREEQG
jgi:hypothetical protein